MATPDRPSRSLPDRPDLRFLKDEAKRRVKRGEFTTLAEAQLAIAREHGFASWPQLKEHVESRAASAPEAPEDQAEALLAAVQAGDMKRLRELIAQGADVDESEEETALVKAAEMGRSAMVKELLKAGADVNFGGLRVPLCGAAGGGHAEVVKLLLDAGAKVDAQEEGGTTPLMCAAAGGHLDVVKMLIKAGADPKATDDDGESALLKARSHPELVKYLGPLSSPKDVEYIWRQAQEPDPRVEELIKAAGTGKVAGVHKLLDAGVPAGGTSKYQNTALHAAAEAGHVKVVEILLAAGAAVDCRDQYGRTPLWEAAHGGHVTVAERLIEAGADLNAHENIEGKTPFLAAISRKDGQRQTMRLLAEQGADIKAADKFGRSAVALAERDLSEDDSDAQALRQLLGELGLLSAGGGQLAVAAGKGDLDTVRRLIESGTSPDAIDEEERTPLYMAVSRQHPQVVAYLLKAGADPNKAIGRDGEADTVWGGIEAPCPKCKTPFIAMINPRHCPNCGKSFDTRKALGAGRTDLPLYVSWHNGFTPLMAAAKLNDAESARMLIDARAKINRGNGDITPLMGACHFGHLDVAKVLIEKGADVKKVAKEPGRGGRKVTAVEIAGKAGHIELVKLLWDAGAPATDKTQTLLVDACKRGDLKAIRKLLSDGADANKADPLTQDEPLEAAAKAGHPDAVEALIKAGAVAVKPASKQFPVLISIAERFQRGWVAKADQERYLAVARMLLDAGARAAVSVFGVTPLSLAEESKCKPLIKMLRAAAEREKAAKKKR